MLSEDQITKFQILYKKRFGKEISRENAYNQGIKLIRLLELIYKSMNESDYQKVQEHRQENNN